MWADQALNKLLADYYFTTVLDVGSGEGEQAKKLRQHGKQVTTIDIKPPADIVGQFGSLNFKFRTMHFDCIWASHVLEHQTSVSSFLYTCWKLLDYNGILAVTVPPLKHEIVGGHVTLWNAGLLLYNLVLAGFDCSEAAVKTYGYNISVIVKKRAITLPHLNMDSGDIHALRRYFPMDVDEGFNGQIESVNWL